MGKTIRLTLIHDRRHWYFYSISCSLLRILAEWCVIVKIRSWPGEKCVASIGTSVLLHGEQSWEAWRGAIMTEWGRNANQPAMRWVWAGPGGTCIPRRPVKNNSSSVCLFFLHTPQQTQLTTVWAAVKHSTKVNSDALNGFLSLSGWDMCAVIVPIVRGARC